MEGNMLENKMIAQRNKEYPLLEELIKNEEVFWVNPKYADFEEAIKKVDLTEEDIKEAEERLKRFAPYLMEAFPETKSTEGVIESPLIKIDTMKENINKKYNVDILGNLLLKCDNDLPIAGSIKARGGIYEVLKHAEDLAIEHNMLSIKDNYAIIHSEEFKSFYATYSIAVGSTGNLGLSIGIISAKLGFKVTVDMSSDAKQWKKDLLRSKGVTVMEYDSDYSKAVEKGREQSEKDPNSYFIDDENSKNLFLGYGVAAYRVKKQLDEMKILVDEKHPLFVYLPCGVGGGPGGVAFGLKLLYKNHVHCFFAEPTKSPCMLIGLMTELHDKVSVQDFGIDNITDADGLAVGRPSGFVGKTLEEMLSGVYTVKDQELYDLLRGLVDNEDIFLEPSALAGMYGPIQLFKSSLGQSYMAKHDLEDKSKNTTHIVWGTGGSLVPEEVKKSYYLKGNKM